MTAPTPDSQDAVEQARDIAHAHVECFYGSHYHLGGEPFVHSAKCDELTDAIKKTVLDMQERIDKLETKLAQRTMGAGG